MRRLFTLGLVVVALAFGLRASADPASPRPGPKNLRELGERLVDVAGRIQKVIEEASKDPDAARIKLYVGYTPEQMKRTRGRVRAEDLVDWMVDPTKNFVTVRQPAALALQEGAQFRGDPELSRTEKQGTRSKRAAFCDKFLVRHLDHDDSVARKLVHELLKKLWGVTGLTEIDKYSPQNDKTWKPAIKKWHLYLKKN